VSRIQAVVVVTTDKCYENQEWPWGYRENDRLGGHDPYSASKACVELVAASYRRAFFALPGAPLLATARAGNVIGGGDWAADRLVPDLVRAVSAGKALEIRSPDATRPWQHVLDALSGYLVLGQRMLAGDSAMGSAWNFGPGPQANQTVASVLDRMSGFWPALAWQRATGVHPHEAKLLYLDSAKANTELGWRTVWSLEDTIATTAEWYQAHDANGLPKSQEQLRQYLQAASNADLIWTRS
jgi:CDP-glucose 4,6-dehydratase